MTERIWGFGVAFLVACSPVTVPSEQGDAGGVDAADQIDAMPGFRPIYVDVAGLKGTLVLQNLGGNDLTVTADGAARFSNDLAEGSTFDVTVLSDPPRQNCHVSGGAGTVGAGDVRVGVTCHENILMWIDDNPNDSQYNHELWTSDGTAAGTGRTVNINQDDTVGSGPAPLVLFNGLYHLSTSDGSGPAIWRTDGLAANTIKLRAFDSVGLGRDSLIHDGALYFVADGDTFGIELWRYRLGFFERLTDLNPGAGNTSFGQEFVVVGNRLVFSAADGTTGDNPWAYDLGTGSSTLLKDTIPGPVTGQAGDFAGVGGKATFRADHDTAGQELWVSDGTAAGTVLLKDLNPGASGSFPNLIAVGGGLAYYRANDGTSGAELWRTDGTSGGTFLVKDIMTGSASSNPGGMVFFAGKAWFVATDANGQELWSTDGTTAGTVKLEVNPSPSIGSNPSNLTVVGDKLYFMADGGDGAGVELWRTDGTPAGTVRVADASPGPSDGIGGIGPYDGRVLYFFSASYDTTELWSSDGTSAGTRKVKDLCVAPMCSPYAQFVQIFR